MAQFSQAYAFQAHNKEVVIQHPHGSHLRVNPNNRDQVDPHGGQGAWARWIVELQNNKQQCKIKSKSTGKYLRIEPNASVQADNKIDVKGQGGKWTVFNIKREGQAGHVKLESAEQNGRYIAIQGDKVIRIGAGGKWCLLKFFREPERQFVNPYLFARTNHVVIQHKGGGNGNNFTKFLRVNGDDIGSNGGKGEFAQWEADPQNNGNKVRLKSLKTGRYLRIVANGTAVNAGGGGGKFTVFNVLKQGNGAVKLQSSEFPNAYIAVGAQNNVRVGAGGKWTELKLFRKN
eukprot:277077_1